MDVITVTSNRDDNAWYISREGAQEKVECLQCRALQTALVMPTLKPTSCLLDIFRFSVIDLLFAAAELVNIEN